MDREDLLRVIVHRWKIVLLVLIAVELGTGLYVMKAQRVYQATATAFIHPVAADGTTQVSQEVQVLAYSTFTQTFTSLAQSRSLLNRAARQTNVDRSGLTSYTVVPTALPGSTVIQLAVQGPDPATAAVLANQLVKDLEAVSKKYYPVYAVSQLDRAVASSTPVSPRTSKDLLYGGAAGLILGLVLAALLGAWARPVAATERALSQCAG